MDRCQKVYKDVSIPADKDKYLLADIFLTEADLCIVPHVVFALSTSTPGRYSFAGTLMGGIAGYLVGEAIDSLMSSVSRAKTVDILSAKAKGRLQREKDFGKPIDVRVTEHQGFRILKERIKSVDYEDGWCTLTSSQIEAGAMLFSNTLGSNLEVVKTMKEWLSGSSPLPAEEGFEGANVGVPPKDLVASLEMSNGVSISSDTFQAVAEDCVYAKKFRDCIAALELKRRTQVLESLYRQARWLLDQMRVDLLKELKTKRKGMIVFFAVLVACPVLFTIVEKLGPRNTLGILLMVGSMLAFLVALYATVARLLGTWALRRKFKVLRVR